MSPVDSSTDQALAASVDSIEQSFSTLFRFVKNNLRDAATALDPELQPASWQVLRQVMRDAPTQVGALALTMGIDKSAISRQLKDLRERGFVETEHSAEDARVVFIRPTQWALERVAAIQSGTRESYLEFLSTWSERDLSDLARLLDRFSEIETWEPNRG